MKPDTSDDEAVDPRGSRAPSHAETLGVDPRLLELLVCPLGGAPLTLDVENSRLVSRRARLAYPIRDGIPILLPGEAEELDEHDPRLHPKPAG